MELWIRSQCKEILLKVDRIGIEEYNNGYGIVTYERIGTKKEFGIGLYKTKERALEVLDEIQSFMKPKYMAKEIETPITNKKIDVEVFPYGTIVYEMPKE